MLLDNIRDMVNASKPFTAEEMRALEIGDRIQAGENVEISDDDALIAFTLDD